MAHVPQRQCVVCRTRRPKADLLRLAWRGRDSLAWDPGPKSAGRGVYLCRQGGCVDVLLNHKKYRKPYLQYLTVEARAMMEAGGCTE